MLLVFFNGIVIGLLILTVIQSYEIKNIKSEINKIKLVQVVTTLKENNIDFKNFKETVDKVLEEGKNESESKV